jgi:hypothetical protein
MLLLLLLSQVRVCLGMLGELLGQPAMHSLIVLLLLLLPPAPLLLLLLLQVRLCLAMLGELLGQPAMRVMTQAVMAGACSEASLLMNCVLQQHYWQAS